MSSNAEAIIFGMDWQEVWLAADRTYALCPACHAVVHKDIWLSGNTLHDHWRVAHPDPLTPQSPPTTTPR